MTPLRLASIARLPRLAAMLLAFLCVLVLLMVSVAHVESQLAASTHKLVSLPMMQKNQGVLLQKNAFTATNVLPVYGTSEITRVEANRASEFFAHAPTGFQVCPVGMAGSASLMTLMKIASLGEVVKNHKLVILLSPGAFARPLLAADHYAGNFSALQALSTLQNPALSNAVKTRIAKRMLDYPETLHGHPFLLMEAKAQVGDLPMNEVSRSLLNLCTSLSMSALNHEDALESMYHLKKNDVLKPWSPKPSTIDWETLIQQSAAKVQPSKRKINVWNGTRPSPMDAIRKREFQAAHNAEWSDFALLLDVLRELHVHALLLSMPIAGERENLEGIEAKTRHDYYYAPIEAMCRERGLAVQTMESHDLDKDFLVDYVSHPTSVGWLHLNRVLDDFWHDRPPYNTWTPTN